MTVSQAAPWRRSGHVPQDTFPHFSGDSPGQFIDYLDVARALELGEPVGAVLIDHRRAQACSADKCDDLFSATPIWSTYHRNRFNPQQLRDRCLHFSGIDVETVDNDQFARSVDQKEFTVEQVADISGREPAILTRAAAAVRPVAREQVVAADPDLPRLDRLGPVPDLDLHAGQWTTDVTTPEQLAAEGG